MRKSLILVLMMNALVLAGAAAASAKEISYRDYMRQYHGPVPAAFGDEGAAYDTSSVIASFAAYPTISSADLATLPKYKKSVAPVRGRHLY